MADKRGSEAANTTLQDLRGNSFTNGGVLGIYVGDFRQTLPVVPRGTPADEINACRHLASGEILQLCGSIRTCEYV